MPEGERKLAAIMFTDMVGYTALTQSNEALAMEVLERHNRLVRPFFPKFNGREVKTIGDSFLVEFGSALDALRCAAEIQSYLHDYNLSSKDEWKVNVRIGIHLGDVIHESGDVFGDAVNIASRIESLAGAEGVVVSEQVYDQVHNKSDIPLIFLGEKTLKNVSTPVGVYSLEMPWKERTSTTTTDLDRRRIAVLPFANLSSDPEEGYFADGITEELITSLSGVRQLAVIARTSVMGYKGTTKKVKEISKELEVGSVLEGTVRKAGNRVRVTAQLIDSVSESHLWAQNYDRQLEDVFAMQSEIAEKVAGELKIRLVDEEKRVIEKKATENTEAYTYYLRGRQLVGERTEQSLRQALGLFEKAVSLDPSYAKAHAAIAECHVTLTWDSYEPFELAAPKAEISVKKALQLDPELAEAHYSLAAVDFLEDRVWESEAEARRATKLNPSLPDAYWILANDAFITGNKDEGIKAFETAYRLDPVRPNFVDRLGRFYFYLGRESDALQLWEKSAQVAPAATYRNMTEYYLNKGDIEKAKESYSRAEKLEPTHRWVTWMKGFMDAKSGDREGAVRVIKEIENRRFGSTDLNDIAFIYFALGDLDSYFTYIGRAADQHTLQYSYAMYSPLFAKTREDPRYLELTDRLKKML